MDVITGSTTPATGTSVTVSGTPGPYTVTGKRINAIYMPNNGGNVGDNYLDLGSHTHHCIDNWLLCPNGWSLSFWYKLTVPLHSNPCILGASHWTLWNGVFATEAGLFVYYFPYSNGTRGTVKLPAKIPYDYWYHVVVTYNGIDTAKLFLDGCLQDTSQPNKIVADPVIRNVEIGCRNGVYCTTYTYDDLYIWQTEKPAWFIWKLYTTY